MAAAAAEHVGGGFPLRRVGRSHRRWPKSAILGSNRRVFGSGRLHASCVIHWGGFPGSGRLCRGSPRRGAELGGGARRRAVLCGRGYATGYDILHKRTRRLMRCSPGSETMEGPVGGELRRRVAGGARWRGTVVELQASGLPGSTPGRDVRVKRGLGWSGGRRRHGNRGGRATYRRCAPGEILGAA